MMMICPQAGYMLIDFIPNKWKKTQKTPLKLTKRDDILFPELSQWTIFCLYLSVHKDLILR